VATEQKPASFHSSPQEAMQSPAEELLYLCCLHKGAGVGKPDFLAVVDAEEGRIVQRLRCRTSVTSLHHLRSNRCSSSCHGRDRSHLIGRPQMLQLSYDARRLYVTNSLYSTWDNRFYPELRFWLLRINCDPDGGMEIDQNFFVDLNDRPGGPARAHEVRLQGGDCTTEIFR
jgi:56kDa selenium binding protein (SBP56)